MVRRSGIDVPWQTRWRLCLLLGAWYTPLEGQFPRIASIASSGSWAVEVGHLDMGRETNLGEGRGATQEIET